MRARENPFRTECILKLRYRLQDMSWPELLTRFRALHYRAALVGPCGSGKTTLLEELQSKFLAWGFGTRLVRLDTEHPVFAAGFISKLVASLTPNDILLFDGAEQLSPLAWHWFSWRTRRARGLLVTLHEPGRLPTLWECRTTPRLLSEIAAELLCAEPAQLEACAGLLFTRHRGNLREALRQWYDVAAENKELPSREAMSIMIRSAC
jgi:hypothetical protein